MDQDILQLACMCTANLCKGKEEDPEIYALVPYATFLTLFIPILNNYANDVDIVSHVTYAISFIAEKSSELKEVFIDQFLTIFRFSPNLH